MSGTIRSFMAGNLAADFTFTSPFDDHIDRAAYFKPLLAETAAAPEIRLRHRDAGRRQGAGRL